MDIVHILANNTDEMPAALHMSLHCLLKCSSWGVYFATGLEVIKLEYNLKLKIKRNDWLLAEKCPQAANHCNLF